MSIGIKIVLFIVWDILFKKQKHSSILWGFQLSRERALKTDGDFSFDLKKRLCFYSTELLLHFLSLEKMTAEYAFKNGVY